MLTPWLFDRPYHDRRYQLYRNRMIERDQARRLNALIPEPVILTGGQ